MSRLLDISRSIACNSRLQFTLNEDYVDFIPRMYGFWTGNGLRGNGGNICMEHMRESLFDNIQRRARERIITHFTEDDMKTIIIGVAPMTPIHSQQRQKEIKELIRDMTRWSHMQRHTIAQLLDVPVLDLAIYLCPNTAGAEIVVTVVTSCHKAC